MLITRVIRPVGVVATEDGYLYRWRQAGEAVDVLPQHLEVLLALPGSESIEVEVIDEPVILPLPKVVVIDPATVPPAARAEGQQDLTGLVEVVYEPPQEESAAAPATVEPAATPEPPTVADVHVSHFWSDADKAHLEQHRPDLRGRRDDEPVQRP